MRSKFRGLSVGTVVALGVAGLAIVPSPATAVPGPGVVYTTADSGPGSLRAAITAGNAAAPGFRLTFSITGRIRLASPLPAVTNRLEIDGTAIRSTASGPPTPVVEIDNNGHRGLVFTAAASGSELLGLSITRASGDGVLIEADNMLLDGNYIGLTPAGTRAGNGDDGVELAPGSSGNRIGINPDQASGVTSNVLSANAGSGLRLTGSTDNTIRTNRLGTDPTGETAIPNGKDGITLAAKSHRNTIGGRAYTDATTGETNNPTGSKGTVTPVFVVPPFGNQASGNVGNGITIRGKSQHNVLNGNFVGTTADGDAALGNGGQGVLIEGSHHNTLQGCRFKNEPFVYYNVLSGNGDNGLKIKNSDDTTVQANFFGVGANNTDLLGNRSNGILISGDSDETQVGGVIPLGNVSAGNRKSGIAVTGKASNFTTFNTFGGLLAFKGAAPNGRHGLLITSTGGGQTVRTNVFSGNDGDGIRLAGHATGVTVDPNIVGLNTRGDGKLSNGGNGIRITDQAHGNTIGGKNRSVIRQNTVAGNDGWGMVIDGKAHHNTIFDTFIGANIQGVYIPGKLPRVGNGKGGVLLSGKAHHNVFAYHKGAKVNKLISGNEGPGVVLRSRTRANQVLNTYIGVGRTGRCLLNKGPNLIDRGTANVVLGNTYCSPPAKDGDRPDTHGLG